MSEDFRSRLRRLRREEQRPGPARDAAPGRPDPHALPEREVPGRDDPEREVREPASEAGAIPAPDPLPGTARHPRGAGRRRGGGMPAWLREKLERRRAERSASAPPAEGRAIPSPAPAEPRDLHPTSLEPPRDLVLREGPEGTLAARETLRPAGERHGAWTLAESLEVDPEAFALLAGDRALAGLELERAVFLDTETTGLSGGAGVHVYMVGLGTFEREGGALVLRVWQGFLRGPGEERALLADVAERIAAGDSLVSFFGKSFDRHRLEDKMRIVGVTPPFAGRPHLDLFHPLQRLYQGTFPDGRLATLERELVGVARASDLPGRYAPEAWFDFLAGRPHRLEGVFQHNLDDVLSLVTLAGHLGRVPHGARPAGEPLAGPAVRRARALARALRDAGRAEEALERYAEALGSTALDSTTTERDLAPHEQREVAFERAELLRKLGRANEALAALDELAAAPLDPRTPLVHEARAKLCEHLLRDRDQALRATHAALRCVELLPRASCPARLARDLEHRAQRLAARTR